MAVDASATGIEEDLTQIGAGLQIFMDKIESPLTTLILGLAIVAGVIAFIKGLMNKINSRGA